MRAFVTLLPQRLLLALVHAYRWLLSPWLGSSCRFEPTCSRYALGALQRHGAAAGSYLVVCRLARCHPWCAGGLDEVPEKAPALFRRFITRVPAAAGASPSTPTPESNP